MSKSESTGKCEKKIGEGGMFPESQPGTKTIHNHPVTRRPGGGDVSLTVLDVTGLHPGKTLLITAGVHGDEFEGMKAIQRVFGELDPRTVRGRLILIPVANPPAYEAGLRVNPDDRQDMARVFPGDPQGTVTEQITHALTETFFKRVDFYLDLHSAGQYYRMPPLVGYQLRPEPLLSIQRAAARAFGLPLIWGTPVYPGRSLTAASDAGVPSLYAEITGEGRCRPDDATAYVDGIKRLMHHLGMVESAHPAPPARWFIEDAGPNAGFLQVQNRAPMGGYFDGEVEVSQRVEKGQRLGAIREPSGRELHVVTAPHAGLVVFLRTFPRVHAGDPVCTVLEIA